MSDYEYFCESYVRYELRYLYETLEKQLVVEAFQVAFYKRHRENYERSALRFLIDYLFDVDCGH